jgi:hypothetical protein
MQCPWQTDVVNFTIDGGTFPPVKHQGIPPSLLLDQNVKWWRTRVSATVDDQFENQGALYLLNELWAVSASYWYFEVLYTCEFKDFIGAAMTPLSRRLAPKAEIPAPAYVDPQEEMKSEAYSVLSYHSDRALASRDAEELEEESAVSVRPQDADGAADRPSSSGYVVGFKSAKLKEAKALAAQQGTSVSRVKVAMGLRPG